MKYIITILSITLLFACKSRKPSVESVSTATSSEASAYSSSSSSGSISPTSYSSSSSSDGEYEDGTYCADVEYYNPNTGTQSSYELEVEVEGGEVTQINFPSGYLDQSNFSSGGELDGADTEIESDKGYTYTVHLTGTSPCRYRTTAVRCIGITKSGNRCRKLTDNPDGYCSQHEFQNDESEDAEKEKVDNEEENDNIPQ